MRTLILMRHAKSDWKQPGLSDHDRPLNARGRRASPLMARHLLDQGLAVDVILASSAARVQQTLALLQKTWATDAELLHERALYLASPQEIASQVQSLPDSWQSAMVIGHNPGMSMLASHLAGEDVQMPTAAVVIFQSGVDRWDRAVTEGQWEQRAFWKPKELEPGAE